MLKQAWMLKQALMLKQSLAISSLLVLSAAGSWAFAEEPAPRFLPPEQVVLYLADKLALSEDQKAEITPIIAERQTKMKAALAENNAGTQQRLREVMEILGDSDRKINAVLNAEQRQKYADVERQMLEQMKQHAQSK
jgi:hypothetical protein